MSTSLTPLLHATMWNNIFAFSGRQEPQINRVSRVAFHRTMRGVEDALGKMPLAICKLLTGVSDLADVPKAKICRLAQVVLEGEKANYELELLSIEADQNLLLVYEALPRGVREGLDVDLTDTVTMRERAEKIRSGFSAHSEIHETELDLSGIGITQFPPELTKFPFLVHLDISNNNLRALPDLEAFRYLISYNWLGNSNMQLTRLMANYVSTCMEEKKYTPEIHKLGYEINCLLGDDLIGRVFVKYNAFLELLFGEEAEYINPHMEIASNKVITGPKALTWLIMTSISKTDAWKSGTYVHVRDFPMPTISQLVEQYKTQGPKPFDT